MKYECPTCKKRMTEMAAEILALRAAVAAVAALLPDSPPFGMVRVVDIWDALHDVTEHKCSAGVSVKHEPPAAPEQFCTRKNDVCDFPDCSCVRREPEPAASRCLCIAYDDGWMDCTAHTKHCGVEVNEDWLCVVCGIKVQIHGRSDDELRRLGQGDVRRPERDDEPEDR